VVAVEGLERASLTRALERRTVVQATIMRATIHLVSRRDYWPFEAAVRASGGSRTCAPSEMHRVSARWPPPDVRCARVCWRGHCAGLRWSNCSAGAGPEAPACSRARRRADLFGPAEDWIGPSDIGEEEGIVRLVSAYLRAFGPASRADARDFCGLPYRGHRGWLGVRLDGDLADDELAGTIEDAYLTVAPKKLIEAAMRERGGPAG
jgi:hypothetical protein